MNQRGSLLGLVCTVAVTAVFAFAGAQEPVNASFAGEDASGAVFEAMRDEFASGTPSEVLGLPMKTLDEGLAEMTGEGPVRDYPGGFEICAHLVGTGGHTRIDGGGDLLAVLPDFLAGAPSRVVQRSEYRIEVARRADHDVVIIDEFNLESLYVSLWARLHEGDVVVDPSDGFDDLWRALVGYLVTSDVDFVDELVVRHGHLVAFHALARLPSQARIHGVEFRRPDHLVLYANSRYPSDYNFEVHLIDVDFDDPVSLRTAVHDAQSMGTKTQRVVILSWGLTDCALGAAYDADAPEQGVAATYDTLVDYMQATLRSSPNFGPLIEELCMAFRSEIEAAMSEAIDCENTEALAWLGSVAVIADISARAEQAFDLFDPDTTFFAAAGNQGLGFPMPPAAWPAVIGVEACTFGVGGRSGFSNAGSTSVEGSIAAQALGAWFAVDASVRHPTAPNLVAELGYWGTSFATPTAAMNFAVARAPMDLTTPLAPCGSGAP